MALKYGSKGKQVKQLQQALLKLGYPLPKWGADGDLGLETWNALRAYQVERGTQWPDGAPGQLVPAALAAEILAAAADFSPPPEPPSFVDVTGFHTGKQRRGQRPWTKVTGIVLHQTAALLGPKPSRWHDVAAHIGVPQNGTVILINPLDELIWHANSFNGGTVGIEISGNFEGIDGDPKTYWKPGGGPHRATAAQIGGTQRAVSWICETVAANGGRVSRIYAHRQSSLDRRADPGSRVWQHVGLWAQDVLGLSDGGPSFKQGGYLIPKDWDPSRTAKY